jgi:hypothetical protein
MTTISATRPSEREILIGLGDRYAVFGPSANLPRSPHFRPETVGGGTPFTAANSEAPEASIVRTLQVHGMRRVAPTEENPDGDLGLLDEEGNRRDVDLKVRESDPRARDFERARERLVQAASRGHTLEVWFLNVERLKLVILDLDRSQVRISELLPANVWERTREGIYDRSAVLAEVADWGLRIDALYRDVREWLADRPLRCDTSRAVTMSEEPMQKFAVAERDLPVLDILDGDQVLTTFLPRHLWMIDSRGWIAVITRARRHTLLAVGDHDSPEWRLVSTRDRRDSVPFDRDALLALVAET